MEIKYSKQALKFLAGQDVFMRQRVIRAIERLPLGDVVKLQNVRGYRLRVGDCRVIFDRDGHVLYIEKIDTRGEVYKRRR
ncbi:MAG: type II toxin-antitoxin system RelE/ParE family toxin [Fretibacterium sp.]|nr:type II toxin-antitoxin system RelE/ParE family toxin [Fretibacterium sp.]